jgi:hypothetical protein
MLRLRLFAPTLGVLLAASFVPAPSARAQTPAASAGAEPTQADVERARALFNEGVALVDRGEWAEAEARFRAALELRPSPVIAYNLASTLEAQGEYVEASELLHDVLAEPDLPQELRIASSDKLAAVLPRIAHLTLVLSGASSEATVALDGRQLSARALSEPLPLDPGRHEVVARGVGGEARASVEASEGESLEVELVLPVPSAAQVAAMASEGQEPTRADDVARRRRRWIWPVVAGVAVVAAVVATSVALTRDGTEAPVQGTFPPGVITVEVGP